MSIGTHRAPRSWVPWRVAAVAGWFSLGHAGFAAVVAWAGWWRPGWAVATVLFLFTLVLLSWAHGYAMAAAMKD